MAVFDLKLILFFLLLFVCITIWLIFRQTSLYLGKSPVQKGTILEALKSAPFGVLVLEEKSIVFSNEFAWSVLHISSDDVLLPDTDWLPMLLEDCSVVRQSPTKQGRSRIITFASGNTARWWVIPIQQRSVVFLLDITAQIRTQHTGRALVNDLGHELRTPVATILTHLEILGLDAVGAEAQQQSVALARKEAQRMGRLINDMLELGRLEVADELPMRAVNLFTLVNDVILQSTPFAQDKGMTLHLDAESNLLIIMGNADRLRQVFLNLVDNAIKYSPNDEDIIIRIENEDSGLRCSVCDHGPGIPSENLPYITQRFYRAAPESVEGSGLGLALVSEILRRHRSQLNIESPVKDGLGTCMHFLLPFGQV
jgi:signal transduction histidine kinase